MRNLTLRGSGSTSVLPAPVVALSCRGFSISSLLSLMSYFWIYRPMLGNRVSSVGRSSPRLFPGSGSLLHAVSFSFARTTKRFPSSRCASAIQMVRPLGSIGETQPQLQPALLRLSAMISQYFTGVSIVRLLLSTRALIKLPRLHTSTPAISKSDSTLGAVPTDFASYDVIQPPISPEVPLLKK